MTDPQSTTWKIATDHLSSKGVLGTNALYTPAGESGEKPGMQPASETAAPYEERIRKSDLPEAEKQDLIARAAHGRQVSETIKKQEQESAANSTRV